MNIENTKTDLNLNGFALLDNLYSGNEISTIIKTIENGRANSDSLIKTKDLFAIRQLLNQIPELKENLLNKNLKDLLETFFDQTYFLTKAIYFNKPSNSNWFVPYHQDLSISVKEKFECDGYINWTYKKGQYGVQPPLNILENTITVRIHLDDTTKENGALRIISESHQKGILRVDSLTNFKEKECFCEVEKGGIMLMKPLTLHASNRTTNNKQRRVIHLEFNSIHLNEPLKWLEYKELSSIVSD